MDAMTRFPNPETEEASLLSQLTEIVTSPGETRLGHWELIQEYPENLARAPNIRATNKLHIVRLAISIATEGQLQNCVGDTLPNGQKRVCAGLHRHDSFLLINTIADAHNQARTCMHLRVWTEEFTPEQALRVQIAENLHEPMRTDEKAKVIEDLWTYYKSVYGEKTGVAKFAREIGRGEGEVTHAIRFSKLDPIVQGLVADGCFTYSFAVDHLSRLAPEKQFPAANRIVAARLSPAKAVEFVNRTIDEERSNQIGLFSEEAMKAMKDQDYRISLRTAADRSAQDAAGYFVKILKLLNRVNKNDQDRVSDTIQGILAAFVCSSDEFRNRLTAADPEIAAQMAEQAQLLAPFLADNRIPAFTPQQALL